MNYILILPLNRHAHRDNKATPFAQLSQLVVTDSSVTMKSGLQELNNFFHDTDFRNEEPNPLSTL